MPSPKAQKCLLADTFQPYVKRRSSHILYGAAHIVKQAIELKNDVLKGRLFQLSAGV